MLAGGPAAVAGGGAAGLPTVGPPPRCDGRRRRVDDDEPTPTPPSPKPDNPNRPGARLQASPEGRGPIQSEGPVRVTLVDGARAGEVADARFAGTVEWWLEGFRPFGPA